MEEYKQVILVRQDLKMPKGKLAVQVSHASVEAALGSESGMTYLWRAMGMKKVVLKVSSKQELMKYKKLADDADLKTALITDAAKTYFSKPTTTCLAIGPDKEELIDEITGKLKML